MKSVTKKLITLVFVVFCIISMDITVFAAKALPTNEKGISNCHFTSYNSTLNYASKELYRVKKVYKTAISFFHADRTNHAFNWIVLSKEKSKSKKQGASTVDTYRTDTGNEEANTLWNTFLDKVSVIETDSKYKDILEIVDNVSVTYAKCYAEATNRTKMNI